LQRFPQRSPNLPALRVRTLSPGDRVFTTAVSMAPVPDEVRMKRSSLVPKTIFSISVVSMKIFENSGVRWWMMGSAAAARTFSGTGVGPGESR
jgi:hypothetical protein